MLTEHDSAQPVASGAPSCACWGPRRSFAVAAALVKAVSPTIPVIEIMLFRSLFALIAMLPLLPRAGGLDALRTRHPVGHVLRTRRRVRRHVRRRSTATRICRWRR